MPMTTVASASQVALVRPAHHRLRYEQKLVERNCAFRDSTTCATVNEALCVVVEDIENEKRLFDGASRHGRVHTDFEVSDPRQRNRPCVSLGATQKADVCSGNSKCCKIVFQRMAHSETSRLMVGGMIANSAITGR